MSENVKPEDIKFIHQLCGRVEYAGFIGTVGNGPEHALYLITYIGVVYARDFECAWRDDADGDVPVTVECFVNIKVDWDVLNSGVVPEKGDVWL